MLKNTFTVVKNKEDDDNDSNFEDFFESDKFLDDLDNDKYVDPIEIEKSEKVQEKEKKKTNAERKEHDRILKENDKAETQREKRAAKFQKDIKAKAVKDDKDDVFSSIPTEILGLDKRQLLAKILQYKSLFPQKLKSFKVKKNPTVEDLQLAVAECDAIVSTDCVEVFLTDSILQCIKLIETTTVKTKYDVQGLSDLLKQNEKFNNLCKQLYLKHQVFANVPPEYQLIMVVGTTSLLCIQKNKKKQELELYLNQPIAK